MPVKASIPITPEMLTPRVIARFYAKADRSAGPVGCWPWTGRKGRAGYGSMIINGRSIRVSRLSFVIHGGVLEPGKFVLHSCDNPPCVNPVHLRAGTHADNMHDVAIRKRRRPAERGTRACYVTGCGHPECKDVNRIYQRAWAARSRNKGPSRGPRITP